MTYNIYAYLYENIYGTCTWVICKKIYFLIVKRVELNLGWPIKNAPYLHIDWKGAWCYQSYELHIMHLSFKVTF
jgi:hypothetical protein